VSDGQVTAAQILPTTPVPQKHGLAFKLVMVAAVLIIMAMLTFAAGIAYLGYVAKKRISGVEKAYKNNDVAGMISAATGQSQKLQPVPKWKPASLQLLSSPSSKIPIRKDLSWVDAGHDSLRGDFESIFDIDSITDRAIHIRGSQQYPNGDGLDRILGGSSSKKQEVRKIECGRTVFKADLENSAETDGYVCREHLDEKHAGTTAVSFSTKTLNDLKSTGQSEFTFHEDPLRAVLESFKNAMNSDSGSSDAASMDLMKKMMNLAPGGLMSNQAMDTPPIKCMLQRESTNDVAIPILVNDQPVDLPAMMVRCNPPGTDKVAHFYVLDDPENPLVLASADDSGLGAQIIKIMWPQNATDQTSQLAEQLEKDGRAKVYDIYFDFRSDQLRPESNKVLAEISDVMHAHPDWKLGVQGHTDNIGGNSYNLDLSKRRAAAVRQALISTYDISPDRLTSGGSGASSPIDTNDTMEGRARNRRVELVRQ
jgi:outer membrane protein OmpA-like peptidoglycan-associated protein